MLVVGTKHCQEVFWMIKVKSILVHMITMIFFHIINYNNVIIPQNSKYGYD